MKRHPIFASILLALVCSAAAWATEIAYVPSLPAPAMPVAPMIPRLPSRIDRIIPGRLPTRSLPGVPSIVPSLRLPAVSFPAPEGSRGVSLPAPLKEKRPVRLPGAVVAAGRIMAAPHAAGNSAKALERLFDGQGADQAPVVLDDADEIGPIKGDSSHLTLPESDLEREIGLR